MPRLTVRTVGTALAAVATAGAVALPVRMDALAAAAEMDRLVPHLDRVARGTALEPTDESRRVDPARCRPSGFVRAPSVHTVSRRYGGYPRAVEVAVYRVEDPHERLRAVVAGLRACGSFRTTSDLPFEYAYLDVTEGADRATWELRGTVRDIPVGGPAALVVVGDHLLYVADTRLPADTDPGRFAALTAEFATALAAATSG